MKQFLNLKKMQLTDLIAQNKTLQFLIGFPVFNIAVALYFIPFAKIYSLKSVFWVGRVLDSCFLENLTLSFVKKTFLLRSKDNAKETVLVEICQNSNFFSKSIKIYSINNELKVSLFRDLIILKEKAANERGVILVKYTPAFDAFYYYFDFDKIKNDYYIVLEPSWAGACDPSFLLFWREGQSKNVVVEALEPKDFRFIEKLGGSFAPISIGSSDWTDSETFSYDPNQKKDYDLIMVSNWGLYKKHRELFRALSKVKSRYNVLLIGFPWNGRTKQDILKELKKYKFDHNITLKENISPAEVSEFLNKSKVFLLLSRKEGGNKAIVESFFANVPAIMYENFKGGVQTMITPQTGTFSSYKKLHESIEYMVENYNKFSPRDWIIKNSGSKISTMRLNKELKKLAHYNNEAWTTDIQEKTNSPNLKYNSQFQPVNDMLVIYKNYKKNSQFKY